MIKVFESLKTFTTLVVIFILPQQGHVVMRERFVPIVVPHLQVAIQAADETFLCLGIIRKQSGFNKKVLISNKYSTNDTPTFSKN
jgi:hypothetical protein